MEIDSAIWLNSVRAVPAIGLKFKTTFDTPSTLISRLKPLFVKWQGEFSTINVGIEQDFTVKVDRSDGVEIKITHDQVIGRFYYHSRLIERGQKLAVVKYQSDHKPFAELCELIKAVVLDVYLELARDGNRTIRRIGIVADGNLDPEGMPPGFELYKKHLGLPWGDGIIQVKSNVLAKINEENGKLDRCHHFLHTPEDDDDQEKVVVFKLDWQRLWSEPQPVNFVTLKSLLAETTADALAYFGRFGIGDLAYAADV